MKLLFAALGLAACMAVAGCAAPQQREAAAGDTSVMGAGEGATPEGAAIAESLGFHGPRREQRRPRGDL